MTRSTHNHTFQNFSEEDEKRQEADDVCVVALSNFNLLVRDSCRKRVSYENSCFEHVNAFSGVYVGSLPAMTRYEVQYDVRMTGIVDWQFHSCESVTEIRLGKKNRTSHQ